MNLWHEKFEINILQRHQGESFVYIEVLTLILRSDLCNLSQPQRTPFETPGPTGFLKRRRKYHKFTISESLFYR